MKSTVLWLSVLLSLYRNRALSVVSAPSLWGLSGWPISNVDATRGKIAIFLEESIAAVFEGEGYFVLGA